MKRATLALLLALISFNAHSEIIHLSTGYGRNREEALIDAKRDAIAQSTGEYINQRTSMSGDKLTTDYIAVVNGIVTSYDIINDFDEKSKQVFIRCHIQENKVAAAVNKDEVKGIDKAALEQLYENHQHQLEAIYDLFSDESLIYDVKVKSTEASVEGENHCYSINISIKRNDSWDKNRSLLKRKIPEAFVARFGVNGSPYVKLNLVRLVDEENKIELRVANTFGSPVRAGKYFLLGADTDYDMTHKICSPKQYTKFDFKFRMVGQSNDSYFSKVGYFPEDKENFDISRVAKTEERY